MDRIKAIVVDDEQLAREAIIELLENESDIEVVLECADGLQAIDAIPKQRPDLVFLDVQMPGADGFSVLEALEVLEVKFMPAIIFVTAYDQYALKAFEKHAVDYLLKPIAPKRFSGALNRVRKELAGDRNQSLQVSLLKLMQDLRWRDQFRERFIVKTRGKVSIVRTTDLVWIEAAGDYVRLHLKNERFLFHGKIGQIEKELDSETFKRIHRSAIVNLEQIKSLQPLFSGDYNVLLLDGTKLTLSRSFRKNLIASLK
ncbi:MAG: LytTR family DNA-binding domain-containing protein [Bacteroidota bacterium]